VNIVEILSIQVNVIGEKNMIKYEKTLITLALLTSSIWGGTSFAHSAHFTKNTRSAEQSFDFRSATMSIYKWYLSPMGAMMKGKNSL
jgi:hypothetical protein